ncbi:sensor histidine kinase [Caproiciproducens galactitolivorans]|uniref:Sensor histidine kinase YehU n=1 Tax=Caproiciproducens galactitolivorans TaxID=642589 RepID=A0A4Z0YG50_9FIRM|nr:sensor histidine kinase [Caproiciproducens galactitolivorans]TGJ75932.1 sensor histidine kinase YehU [Caproiciproducens galactitolivorans]
MNREKNPEGKKKRSLKTNVLFTVIFFWVLPLLVIIGIAGVYTSDQIRNRMMENITNSVIASAEICAAQIDASVNASYAATYNPDISDAYYRYLNRKIMKYSSDELYADVTNFLKVQYGNSSQFDMTVLYYDDDPDTLYYTYNETSGMTFVQYQKYHTDVHEKICDFAKSLGNRVGFYSMDGKYYLVRNLVNSYTFAPYATLVLQLNKANVFGNLMNVVYGTDSTVWIDDSAMQIKGSLISKVEYEAAVNSPNRYPALITGSKKMNIGTLNYAIRINSSEIMASLAHFQLLLFLLCLLVLPLLCWAYYFFTRNVTRPISRFLEMYQKLGNGNFGIHMEEDFPNRDFEHLSKDFNRMSDRLKAQFEQIYNDELALRDAKIMALQAQINPYFLNNTLELINWESRMIGNEKISNMINALATMLNAAMCRKNSRLIPLSEEMKYVNSYLYIIKQRLGSRLTVKMEIDESLLTCMVPRLVMQPILENAVEHGVDSQRNGEIFIRVYRVENQLTLEVENTGIMTEDDKQKIARLLTDGYNSQIEHSGSLGIHNVYQRLHILYGSYGNLEISTAENGNTVAKITLPAEQKS